MRLASPPGSQKTEKLRMFKHVDDSAYFSHPENVLISMLTDRGNPALRKRAANIIRKLRTSEENEVPEYWEDGVRPFVLYSVNWCVSSYDKFLDAYDYLTEPPVTKVLSMEAVDAIAKDPANLPDGLTSIPCHTQVGFFVALQL